MFKVAEGIFTDSEQGREVAQDTSDERTWNPVEGKWEY